MYTLNITLNINILTRYDCGISQNEYFLAPLILNVLDIKSIVNYISSELYFLTNFYKYVCILAVYYFTFLHNLQERNYFN